MSRKIILTAVVAIFGWILLWIWGVYSYSEDDVDKTICSSNDSKCLDEWYGTNFHKDGVVVELTI